MGHQYGSLASVALFTQEAHHEFTGHRVEGAGRLVGQHQSARADVCASDRNTLALTPGEVIRKPIRERSHLDTLECRHRLRARSGDSNPVEFEWQSDVFDRGQAGQ